MMVHYITFLLEIIHFGLSDHYYDRQDELIDLYCLLYKHFFRELKIVQFS